MQRFAQLVTALSNSTKTNDKRDLLVAYLKGGGEEDNSDARGIIYRQAPQKADKQHTDETVVYRRDRHPAVAL